MVSDLTIKTFSKGISLCPCGRLQTLVELEGDFYDFGAEASFYFSSFQFMRSL